MRKIFLWALVAALSTQAHAQKISQDCSDVQAARALNQNLFLQLWNMNYRHLAAEYIGVGYDNLALMTSGVSASAQRLDESQYHGIIKKVISIDSTRLVDLVDRGSGYCNATIIFSPPISSDKKYNVFGETEVKSRVTFQLEPYAESNGGWTAVNVEGGREVIDIWHFGVERLYAFAFANLMQNPEIRQKIDQLRVSAAGEHRAQQQDAAREQQLAKECSNRGGFWGHHTTQQQLANGTSLPAQRAGDPDHCIMN